MLTLQRTFRLSLALLIVIGLSACVTDPDTGKSHFNPWKGAQNMDEGLDRWILQKNADDNLKKPDVWNR